MREYKAITKTPMIPTRSNGMGKLMVEIIDVHLLSNNVILRDWIIIHDENGKEVYREVLKDYYNKHYPDEAFSPLFSSTDIELNSPQDNYSRLKDMVEESVVIMNNFDPPYSLPTNSFEKYTTPGLITSQI